MSWRDVGLFQRYSLQKKYNESFTLLPVLSQPSEAIEAGNGTVFACLSRILQVRIYLDTAFSIVHYSFASYAIRDNSYFEYKLFRFTTGRFRTPKLLLSLANFIYMSQVSSSSKRMRITSKQRMKVMSRACSFAFATRCRRTHLDTSRVKANKIVD